MHWRSPLGLVHELGWKGMFMDELIRLFKAMLVLQSEIVAKTKGAEKAEVLLSRVGLSHKEIAAIVGKPQTGVSKAISRANAKKKEQDDE